MSIDELPQLFNILNGDMSIIGPRPALWNQENLIAERDKYGANSVRPGLTGLAQIGGKPEDIKVIGIRHGEKMYETLLTNEECAKAVDMGNFYRVPADNRGLNYDKYFKEGDETRNTLTEFNSNNTRILNVEETKAKIAALSYIQDELKKRNA